MAENTSGDCDVMELSEAVKLISKNAQDVFINKEKIKGVAENVMQHLMKHINIFYKLNNNFLRPKSYPYEVNEQPIMVNWLFVLNTLNFSLWYPKNIKQWKVDGREGYIGLCNAIRRAIENETPVWNPEYYARMTKSELEHILRSDDGEPDIPLIDERLKILHEVGEVLLTKYNGTFLECIKLSDYDADKLMKLLFDEFESYRDEVIYDGKKVRFLVKARSLVCDMCMYFKNKPSFKLNTSNMMSTIFTDYCIPQVLFKLELISYSKRLVKRFANNDEPLEHGSREEIEIRGCSLFAAKEICKEVIRISQRHVQENRILKSKKAFNPQVAVDNFLLKFAFIIPKVSGLIENDESLKLDPLHYIRSVHY
ncbi:queuosine salvage protein-like [Nylanderia fulva]|uniref:queuosine salvage protein-like n=1 Tax=Nylanderia fulva TaxID=613905 RepID=UPI0010FB0E58|nr:queuosine salvage protein-like [Nylanderia fulva]